MLGARNRRWTSGTACEFSYVRLAQVLKPTCQTSHERKAPAAGAACVNPPAPRSTAMGFFGKKAGEGSKKAGAPAPAPGISQSERPAEGAGSSSLSRAKTAAPGSLAGEGSGSGGDNMWLDSKPQARHTTYAPRQHSVDIDDDGLSPNKKGPHRVTNLTDEQLAKEQKARANTLRFKLSTPPTAEVEVTGIYSDRTYGAKVSAPRRPTPSPSSPPPSRLSSRAHALPRAGSAVFGRPDRPRPNS